MLTLVRDAVTVDADTIEREGLVAWAVYGVGDRFFTGRAPIDVPRLVRLYPNEVENIAAVSYFPDAASARRAANGLRRAGFSIPELRAIFRMTARPGSPTSRLR
jgi:hypothetical protein